MQSTSTMQKVSLPENLRNGQKETVELFYKQDTVISKLPTGYGKTKTAACSYALLRGNGRANRVLYVVPRYNQAVQAAGSFPASLYRDFGIKTKAYQVGENQVSALNAHKKDTAEVFVVTIQSLVSSPATIRTVKEMMSKADWFVVIDEHHHYSGITNDDGDQENGKWVEAISRIPNRAMLVMSATPKRQDGKDYFGDPHVSVRYTEALEEGAVKEMNLHAYEYQVDAIGADGEVSTYTTGDLFDEAGGSPDAIEEFLVKRKMRWSPKYISPLVLIPAERMANLRANGIKSQMIIQAMSCSHAEMVCSQVKVLLPTLNVDWVGTGKEGRTDKDNKRIIDEFCPEEDKYGVRHWTMDVLVNVGMAGEGLDSKDCTEVCVLTPGNITTSLLQLFGRGARVMSVGDHPQPRCHLNVDTDSVIAQEDRYLGRKVMALFDDDVDPDDISNEHNALDDSDESEYKELPDALSVIVTDVRFVDIKMEPNYLPMVQELECKAKWSTEEAEKLVEKMMRDSNKKRDDMFNASAQEAMSRSQIAAAVTKIVGLILRRMTELGMRIERSLARDLNTRIRSMSKRVAGKAVPDSNPEELGLHYAFVKEVEQAIFKNHGLSGVPKWLR